ncbi:MAG: hypothetical protein IJX77_08750 [Ruminococcus sp.]|nr:hypothetical protein [Ruminococcus sp.]
MANLIKSELYRLLKSRCTYVLLIITAFFAVINPLMYKTIDMIAMEEMEAVVAKMEESVEDDGTLTVGFSSYGGEKWYDSEYSVTISDFIQENVSGAFILLFLSIFAALFIGGEIKHGYVKSILTHVGNRRRLALANFAAVEFMLLLMFIVNFASSTVTSLILFDGIRFGETGDFMIYMLVQFLLHSAFAALIQLLVYLLRSTAFSMTIGICLSSGMGSLIISLLSLLAVKFLGAPSDFSLSKYTITENIMALIPGAPADELSLPLIVGFAGTLLFFALACFTIEKKDIR